LRGCLLVFGLIAAWVTWSTPSTAPLGRTSPTVTLVPGAARPAGLRVVDLSDRDATRGQTPRPVSSGATVIGDSGLLARDVWPLLRQQQRPALSGCSCGCLAVWSFQG
jgi:hypothetical protein